MPEICRFYGIIIAMFPQDHNPPHFHVVYNGNKAIVDIQSGTIKGSLPKRALHLVCQWLDLHKEELLRNWDKLAAGKEADEIEPLD